MLAENTVLLERLKVEVQDYGELRLDGSGLLDFFLKYSLNCRLELLNLRRLKLLTSHNQIFMSHYNTDMIT